MKFNLPLKKEYLTTGKMETEKVGKEVAKFVLETINMAIPCRPCSESRPCPRPRGRPRPRRRGWCRGQCRALGLASMIGKQAIILGLIGELGSGKTTFLKGFAKGLGIKEKILSPTFIIMKRFSISHSFFRNFYHFDCYRIEKPKELLILGFEKIISDPKNIICLEWAEKIKKILPQNNLIIKFDFINSKTRKIIINQNPKNLKVK